MEQGQIKFGLSHYSNDTPEILKKICNFILYLTGLLNIVLFTIPEIPEHTKYLLCIYSSSAVSLIRYTVNFFGVTGVELDNKALQDANKNNTDVKQGS